jgi:hypothetical protein
MVDSNSAAEPEGWKAAYDYLKEQDESMAKSYEDDINSLLTFVRYQSRLYVVIETN